MEKPGSLPVSRQPSTTRRLLGHTLRIFFKLLYHQFAFSYDWVASAVSMGNWNNWIYSTLEELDGPKVLEIGFGPGHLQRALNQKGTITFGVDQSSQMVRLARQRLSSHHFPHKLTRGVVETLPFAAGSFNQVVMTFPAEFIYNPTAFTEIHRVLVDKGRLIIIPIAWITGHKMFERLAAWLFRITGEAPDWDEKILTAFKIPGFDLSWKIIPLQRSQVLIISLKKSSE